MPARHYPPAFTIFVAAVGAAGGAAAAETCSSTPTEGSKGSHQRQRNARRSSVVAVIFAGCQVAFAQPIRRFARRRDKHGRRGNTEVTAGRDHTGPVSPASKGGFPPPARGHAFRPQPEAGLAFIRNHFQENNARPFSFWAFILLAHHQFVGVLI